MGSKTVYYCDVCEGQVKSCSELCSMQVEINGTELIDLHCCSVECAIKTVDKAAFEMRSYVNSKIREILKNV